MIRSILIFGAAAGLCVAAPMFTMLLTNSEPGSLQTSAFTGYLIMIVALGLILVAVKRHRDRVLGGVIKFAPALFMGLGISLVAGLIYAIGWEIALAATDYSFADLYANAAIEAARAKGKTAVELERLGAEMEAFKRAYANPLIRLPMTFIEIFPVGVLVSLVSAALLRNPRFMPARSG